MKKEKLIELIQNSIPDGAEVLCCNHLRDYCTIIEAAEYEAQEVFIYHDVDLYITHDLDRAEQHLEEDELLKTAWTLNL